MPGMKLSKQLGFFIQETPYSGKYLVTGAIINGRNIKMNIGQKALPLKGQY